MTTGILDGWTDITSSIAAERRVANVSVAWRKPGKGRPMLEFLVNNKLAAQLGWTGGICATVLAAPDRRAIAFVPHENGKALRDRSGGLAVSHRVAWIDPALPPQPAEIVPHRVEGKALLVTLPAWARGGDRDAADETTPPQPAPVKTHGGRNVDQLTPEREALFRSLWPDGSLSVRAVMNRLNALPGEPYSAPTSMYSLATRLKMPTERMKATPPADVAPASATPASFPPAHFRPPVVVKDPPPEVEDEDAREAEALIRANSDRWHGRAIADEYGWPIDKAATFARAIRSRMARERQDAAE